MKYHYSLTVESPDFQPDVNVTWPASQTLLMAFLKGVTVTRLRIENIEEPSEQYFESPNHPGSDTSSGHRSAEHDAT